MKYYRIYGHPASMKYYRIYGTNARGERQPLGGVEALNMRHAVDRVRDRATLAEYTDLRAYKCPRPQWLDDPFKGVVEE